MARQQFGYHRIDHASVVGDGRIDLGLGRKGGNGRNADCIASYLIVHKPEALVFPEWSAQGEAEVVVVKCTLRRTHGIKEVSGVERVVAKIFVNAAVDAVGPRLRNQVDGGAGAAAILGFRSVDDGNFLQRVHGKNGRRRSEYAALVDGRQIAVAIVHVGAVEEIVVGASTIAVDAEQSERSCGIRTAGSVSA